MALQSRQALGLAAFADGSVTPTRGERVPERLDVKHLERLVERTRDEVPAVRRERDRVDRVHVALELVEELTRLGIPDADDRVERTGREELAVGRKHDRRDSGVDGTVLGDGDVVNRERKDARARLEVPHPRRLVARARNESATVRRERERVDLALVALEHLQNALLCEVPDLSRGEGVRSKNRLGPSEKSTARTLTMRSSEPVARYLPSGLNDTERM